MARGRSGQTKADLVTASVLSTASWELCLCSLLLRRISIQCRHLRSRAAMAVIPGALIYQACGSQKRTTMFLQCGRPFIIDLPGRVYSSWKMEGSTFRGHSREQEQYHIQAVSWSTIDYSVPVNLENVLIVWYFQPWKDWVSGRRWISAKLFYTPLGRLCDCTQSLRERRHVGKAEVASAARTYLPVSHLQAWVKSQYLHQIRPLRPFQNLT